MLLNLKPKISVTLVALVVLGGCSAKALDSSAGFYRDTPGAQEVKGSYGQTVKSYLVEHDVADVKTAVIKGASFSGLTFDNVTDNVMTGTAQWTPPGFTAGCLPNQVYAVYLTEVSARETNVTIVADHLSWCAMATNSQASIVQNIAANMNRILATYE